jgi:hypothetical protein
MLFEGVKQHTEQLYSSIKWQSILMLSTRHEDLAYNNFHKQTSNQIKPTLLSFWKFMYGAMK